MKRYTNSTLKIMDRMPPGFRFYPTEEELVSFYLRTKLDNNTRHDLISVIDRVIPVLDIYAFNPSDLPKYSGQLCSEDLEQWFFFIPRQESEARGGRPNRLTSSGYWKATGSPGYVYSLKNKVIGLKRTMVFYGGRAPSGKKTDWKMNEYKAIAQSPQPTAASSHAASVPTLRQEYSLCRVYKSTKCLRAFDRRPLGPSEAAAPQQPNDTLHVGNNNVNNEENGGVVNHEIPRLLGRPGANSAETTISSSSGDHAQYPAETSENDNYLDMEIESSEALWNWDQANWFSGLM